MVEHACSVTSLQLGETLGGITKDMDTYTYREPLGVCAGVTPFNFPAMIPLWVGEWVEGVPCANPLTTSDCKTLDSQIVGWGGKWDHLEGENVLPLSWLGYRADPHSLINEHSMLTPSNSCKTPLADLRCCMLVRMWTLEQLQDKASSFPHSLPPSLLSPSHRCFQWHWCAGTHS